MQNKKLIILIVLAITAVFSLIYGIVTPTRGRRGASSKTISREEKVKSTAKIIPARRRAKRTNFVFWGRNPFAPEEMPRIKVVKFTLNGILWDEENPKALINNIILEIGDKIEENTIIDIKHDRVILNDGTNDFELRLMSK